MAYKNLIKNINNKLAKKKSMFRLADAAISNCNEYNQKPTCLTTKILAKDGSYAGYIIEFFMINEIVESKKKTKKPSSKKTSTRKRKPKTLRNWVFKLIRADPCDWILDHKVVYPDYWELLELSDFEDFIVFQISTVFPKIVQKVLDAGVFNYIPECFKGKGYKATFKDASIESPNRVIYKS